MSNISGNEQAGKSVKTNRIVAYIDLLGFTDAARNDDNLDRLVNLLQSFVNLNKNFIEQKVGKTAEGNDIFNIYPAITACSDTIVISYPLNGILPARAIIMQLGTDIANIALRSLQEGFLIRGGVAQGTFYHEGGVPVGSAYITAYELERDPLNSEKDPVDPCKSNRMPRVIVQDKVVETYGLDQPSTVSVRGALPTVLPDDYSMLLKEHNPDESIYSIKYINEMIRLGITPGDAWWDNVTNRVNRMKDKIAENKDAIRHNPKLLAKWSWFEKQVEKEYNFLAVVIARAREHAES